MKTSNHIDALQSAIVEARATLHDQYKAEIAVEELKRDTLPWTYTTTSKAHVVQMQLAGHAMAVKRRWSWHEFTMVYEVTVR